MTFLLYALLTALASLNRETSLLLPILYFAYHGRSKWRESAVLLAIWVIITTLLHVVIGSYPHQLGLLGTWEYNLGNVSEAVVANLLLLPLAWLAVASYKESPPILKRFFWVGAIYILAIIVGGSWMESQRLVLPILPIYICMIVHKESRQVSAKVV